MPAPAASPKEVRPKSPDFSLELKDIVYQARRGFSFRFAPAVATALVTVPWLGWSLSLLAIALLAVYELFVFALVYRRLVKPLARSAPAVSRAILYTLLAGGGAIYVLCWAPVFLQGSHTGIFVGCAWICGSVIHNATYFARKRSVFFAAAAPQVLVLMLGPFFMNRTDIAPWAMLYMTLQTLATIIISMNDRRHLEELVARNSAAAREAEEANRAKSRFLATMSHELRTPLNAIIGYSEIIEEDIRTDTGAAHSVEDARRIQRAARHLLSLINEVLDLSKLESGRIALARQPVDVEALLQEVREVVRPLADANGNRIDVDVEARLPHIQTDRDRLRQCLVNLAANACKFTSGGRVTMHAKIDARAFLNIIVEDTGIGIAPEDQARLFEPFVQVDGSETRQQDGSGLGLAIARRIAQAMGGDIGLVSTPGLGSTFTLRIPATAENAVSAMQKDVRLVTIATTLAHQRDAVELRALLRQLSSVELAALLARMPDGARESLLLLVGAELPHAMLQYLPEELREHVLDQFPEGRFAQEAARLKALSPEDIDVLVIEDDQSAHDLTRRALERLPLSLRFAETGAEGLDRTRLSMPGLIILDIHLPDMSGWAVLEQIKQLPGGRDVPVLVVTIDDDRARAIAHGACDHMVKPVDRDRLAAAAMRFAFNRRPTLSAHAAPVSQARSA